MEIIISILLSALAIATVLIIRNEKRKKVKPASGGVYTIKNAKGKFQIIKVLALSKKGNVHYLIYPADFTNRPETLQISVMADKPVNTKIEITKFYKLSPVIIGQIKINNREIQRYLRHKAS